VTQDPAQSRSQPGPQVKIAIVVQRYGADVSGGAELHARYIAEHLAKHVQVEVLTTCATDYITWRNALPAGTSMVTGVPVHRFPVSRERDPAEFGRHSDRVFKSTHAFRDELAWLDAEGPTSPELIDALRAREADFDFFVFFSFRYYHAYHGVRAVPGKAILVPTAERDGALGLSMFGPVFRGVRALMYNSYEERALIRGVSQNEDVPSVVVGVGSEVPPQANPLRFRQKFNIRDRFAIYIGRIDENKGCAELFDYFQRYSRLYAEGLHLVLIGTPVLEIPKHPRIHHLGFVEDQDKYDALAAAELLLMPSYFESLSMVALEAWAMGKPVLANGRCDVLKGQCIRSNGGLYYDNFAEFLETLRAIDWSPLLAASLGRNGREYFSRHYTWPVIEQKYLDMFERLKREPASRGMEPWPGWWARRRLVLPPAEEVVARLPRGAALGRTSTTAPPAPPTDARTQGSDVRRAEDARTQAAPVRMRNESSGRGDRPHDRSRFKRPNRERPQRRRAGGRPPGRSNG
jgi:glycosyltransferase involved in cell wall biosynthesis